MKKIQFRIGKIMPVLLFTVCFLFCTSAFSKNYYVSSIGNDATGDGSEFKPWKTLFKATSSVNQAGDIILLISGKYLETNQIKLSKGVSIEGSFDKPEVSWTGTAYFEPIIVCISPEGTKGNQHISNVIFDGRNVTSFAIDVKGRSGFEIYNCEFINFEETGVIMTGQINNAPGAPGIYAEGCTFHDNVMNNCAKNDGNWGRGCFMFGGMDGMLIYNNTITQNQRPNGQNGWPIKGWDESHIKNCKIYNNKLTTQPFPYGANGENGMWDFAIELFEIYGGVEIYGNTMTGALDLNHQMKTTFPYSVWIHDNTIGFPNYQANRQSGIILEYETETAIIENNIIRNCVDGIRFSMRSLSPLTNTVIRKNLIYNVAVPGGGYGAAIGFFTDGSANYTISGFDIYNNTILGPGNDDGPWSAISFEDAGSVKNVNIKNNIIAGFNLFGSYGQGIASNVLGNISQMNIQYNAFFNNGLNAFPSQGSIVVSNNVTANPLFATTTNYTLQANSPLIDAGINVGLPFVGLAPDKGYAEYNASALPVILLDFGVTNSNGNNILLWKTATESNSDYFNIERSSNGINFEVIGKISASGFSSSILNYNFTDLTPLEGINYYRLSMVDKDNSSALSNIVSISSQSNHSLDISAAKISNINNNVFIKINSDKTQKVQLTIFDRTGRFLFNQPILLQKGSNTIDKKLTVISKGIYYIKVFTENDVASKNILSID